MRKHHTWEGGISAEGLGEALRDLACIMAKHEQDARAAGVPILEHVQNVFQVAG